jgi:hypothetical protein
MAQQGRWRRLVGHTALAASLVSSAGCLNFLNATQAPPAEVAANCQELPAGCRRHIYIFLVHGLDPLDSANLDGLCTYLHKLGFNQTYYGQLYHVPYFGKEIRRLHKEDPDAHFVLIGFSFGANQVCSLTRSLKEDGIGIDLLVYLGGNTLDNTPADRPDNARRIVNVLAHGWIWNGAILEGAENIEEPDIWHFGSPTHPRTLQTLTEELTTLAATVPAILPSLPSPTPTEEEPTPRPVQIPPTAKRDEWDFLKPTSDLPVRGVQIPPSTTARAPAEDSTTATTK